MSIHVALHHRSHYRYDRLVAHAPHVIRLRPSVHCRTPVLGYSLRIIPGKHFLNWQQDPFGNYLARLVLLEPCREFLVEVDLIIEMAVHNPFDFFLEPSAERFPFDYDPELRRDLAPFLELGAPSPLLDAWVRGVDRRERRTITVLVELNQRLLREVRYLIRLEPGVQEPEITLRLRSGSCRDSAWLLVQILRRLGLAARFVSGYLIQLRADVTPLDGPAGPLEDFTDLHAWCEVYLPGAGWIGLDPTSGLLAGEGHIPLACTPNPTSAAPVTGSVDLCEAVFEHQMKVSRVHESPRVTRPYSDGQWRDIENLGRAIDADLQARDVRLTMGGEPTFVSRDNMEGEEWTFAAIGPEKLALSGVLIRRLRRKFAPGGLLHFGQGKWYPGEQLPRWAYGCYWRKDSQPIWRDEALFADVDKDYGHGPAEAERFIRRLAANLELEDRHVMPAYEDAWFYLWRERRLPSNVDPLRSRLEDPIERERLARVFSQGLNQVVGFVLPVRRRVDGPRGVWESGPWFLRREHCFLLPGDSPMGLRLPLDSIPWVSSTDYPILARPDPSSQLPPLPEGFRQLVQARLAASLAGNRPGMSGAHLGLPLTERPPGYSESAEWIVRTGLCVEPRQGRLHVFIPPLAAAEEYLELIAAIEESAAGLDLPVVIEGEPPPPDPRLRHFKVTPDPGVIEVNVPPAASWEELSAITETLYEEARLSRLAAEKFAMDGRHVGTGGGNHLVLGGATPADSPLLRRPDLLRSLLTYWQNHPSLSFLFSSQFIGPTSQHPRVDEARNDSLYELEMALRQLPAEQGSGTTPWLVDRLFRHLLIDATGNTHRAEFCIDKLFNPEQASGRLGLLELRAFEMPPHARMSLAQALLLRGLIAWFWQRPCERPLVRWGTELHDRYMLPHFVEQDFMQVLEDLRDWGYRFEPEWYAPHLEFRFPRCGAIAVKGMVIELRQALEPWHVLGEQEGPGGTVRLVDSSLDRLQVKAQGFVDGRHVVACNGRRLPLFPTGVEGEYVAGVRFRGWQPPECLHPTIGVHAPLTFDLHDTWNQRAAGGCKYHVAHPGGLNHTSLPVNAFEAESRRQARFFAFGHSPGTFPLGEPKINPEFPLTLDLRHG